MASSISMRPAQRARNFPLYRTLPRLLRDPLKEMERMATVAGGDIVRMDLGVVRPLVVTHPDHLRQILRENPEDYIRDGVFWRPVRRIFGDSILAESEEWEFSRRVLQPVFTARHVDALTERMAETINDAVDALEESARSGRPVRVFEEMSRIVTQTVIRIFFGAKITSDEAARLAVAFDAIVESIALRYLLPFVPRTVPMPGDRTYRENLKRLDEMMHVLVRRCRNDPGEGRDIFTALCQARTPEGGELPDQWIRNNLCAMFGAGTETSNVVLSWVWPLLAGHPEVAGRLQDEIDDVVGTDRPRQSHLPRLTYTKQVVQEVLRLYPAASLIPRIAKRPGNIGGLPIKTGQSVLYSPYLTHRLESFWERPLDFDPDRFAPDRDAHRHRYAYIPFGGGPHQCVAMHVFPIEAQLIIASILSRFRPVFSTVGPCRPRIGISTRPIRDDGGELEMTLVPKGTVA
jgi:cytochrome P450